MVTPIWKLKQRRLSIRTIMTILLTGMLGMFVPGYAVATPDHPHVVPDDIGAWDEYRSYCENWGSLPAGNLPFVGWFANLRCQQILDGVQRLYKDAYVKAENEGASPGYPRNASQIHYWHSVEIQDSTAGNWGDGAIMWGETTESSPCYIGGGAWNAFTRAANSYGVWPGYPINTEHDWGAVRIQDLRGGDRGEGAIIGGGNAELVAGTHWAAYKAVDGSNRLRNPLTFVNQRNVGFWVDQFDGGRWVEGDFWVQEFDGGQIFERNGTAYVWFYDTGIYQQVLP